MTTPSIPALGVTVLLLGFGLTVILLALGRTQNNAKWLRWTRGAAMGLAAATVLMFFSESLVLVGLAFLTILMQGLGFGREKSERSSSRWRALGDLLVFATALGLGLLAARGHPPGALEQDAQPDAQDRLEAGFLPTENSQPEEAPDGPRELGMPPPDGARKLKILDGPIQDVPNIDADTDSGEGSRD